MDMLGVAYEMWEGEGHVKPEKWWNRFGDEPDHYNQILRLIHRLAKIRKLVRECTRDNQKLVNIYQQILQQADNTFYEDRSWPSLLPINEEWASTALAEKTIQEREDLFEKIGPETFEMKVQEEAIKWAEGEIG